MSGDQFGGDIYEWKYLRRRNEIVETILLLENK